MASGPKCKWSDLRCVAGMQSESNSSKACDVPPDELNHFHAPLENPENPTAITSPTQHAAMSVEQKTEHQVGLQLKQIGACKNPRTEMPESSFG